MPEQASHRMPVKVFEGGKRIDGNQQGDLTLTRLVLAHSTESGSLGLRPSPTNYSELRQDMCSWFVFRYQRNTGVRASAGSSFQWPVRKPEGWARTNCTFRLIRQKNHRRHTGHLAVCLRRRSMRDCQQRNPLMSKWNTDYKIVGEMRRILSKQKQNR